MKKRYLNDFLSGLNWCMLPAGKASLEVTFGFAVYWSRFRFLLNGRRILPLEPEMDARMVSRIMAVSRTVLVVGALVAMTGGVAAQEATSANVPVGATGIPQLLGGSNISGSNISDRLAEQIKTLMLAAIRSGNASLLENGLFDLVAANPNLAPAIAKFTTTIVPATVSAGFSQSLFSAAIVGPATAAPSMYKKIVNQTNIAKPELTKSITASVKVNLANLFIGKNVDVAKMLNSFVTSAGLAETPTTQSASPSG